MSARSWNIVEVAAELRAQAGASGLSVIDLAQGTPTTATPGLVQTALAEAGNAPGYPTTHGTPEVREAYSGWCARSLGADVDPEAVLPTIGSKECIASLPEFLGLGEGSLVAVPALAYPTYEVGARRAGARVAAVDGLVALGPQRPDLMWLNTPSNPTGQVLGIAHLRKVVQWARSSGCIVASDECYLDLWYDDVPPVSILHPEVCDGDYTGILAVHSLSKRSAMAGYRAGFVSGDPQLVAGLLQLRRNAGLMQPAPVQAAAAAALADDAHVIEARRLYARHRDLLLRALKAAGMRIEHSQAGLFLWATAGRSDIETLEVLAAQGIVAAPGSFYGPSGARHVRIALTATTSDTLAAADRIRGLELS